MKTTAKMQETVTALAQRHGLDLREKGAYLRLDMPHFDRLVIEVLHPTLVSVAHVYEPRPGVHLADPGIVFLQATALGCRLRSCSALGAIASMPCFLRNWTRLSRSCRRNKPTWQALLRCGRTISACKAGSMRALCTTSRYRFEGRSDRLCIQRDCCGGSSTISGSVSR